MPRVGLFIPCYVDQFYPEVGMATVEVLEKYGRAHDLTIEYPEAQTCCGQPMANTGCTDQTLPLARRFVQIFKGYDYIVCPSGSCSAMVRQHYGEYFHCHDKNDKAAVALEADYQSVRSKTFELCEFLGDVLKVEKLEGSFPHRVGLHQSCHGLRELRLGSSSEIVGESFSKARKLLQTLEGITFAPLVRPDECCGFGGTFAIAEEAVSCMMGQDRIHDHEQGGTEVMTAMDMSCLMHLDGLLRRDKKPIKVMHVAEILAGRQPKV
jgi:L-lactate dehydrogenase complex protein LldE